MKGNVFMKRLFVVENKNAKVEWKMESVTIKQINDIYNQLCKSGLGWKTKEFKNVYDEVENNVG